MKQALFTGVGTAIVTPFKNGAVNFPAFGRLIDRQLAGGVHAIIVCGTTGEAATMTQKERLETIQYCIDRVAGRIPVIAGAGPIPQKSPVKTPRLRNTWGQTGC